MSNLLKELCGWCGSEIAGEPVAPYEHGPLIAGGAGQREIELLPGFKCGFCSEGCAWAFAEERSRRQGMRGKELRQHLELEHGLTYAPCSRPHSAECCARLEAEARVLADWQMKLRIARRAEETIARRFPRRAGIEGLR